MRTGRYAPRLAVTALLAGSLALTACGSSGGGTKPSQNQLIAKLRTDPQFSTLGQVPKDKADPILGCLAGVMEKYLSAGQLNAYVQGKKKLDDLEGKSSDESKATADVETCLKPVTGG